jgi:hypothetical protein
MSVTRLLRLLTIVALLFGSYSMAGGHAAMAMPSSSAPMMHHAQDGMAAGHCADMGQNQKQKDQTGSNIDCTIACAVILSAMSEMEEGPIMAPLSQPLMPVTTRHGLNPESDPPPPRLS